MRIQAPVYCDKSAHKYGRALTPNPTGDNQYSSIWLALLGLSVIVGLYVRIDGLWLWPFAVDEYFLATSVENILKHGFPQFDCGGFYNRGILIQYLVAFERMLGISPELAPRIISVIAYVVALPALFYLAKRISGIQVASACIILLSLSVWEVEFARFGRMYAPFQALFLWYMVFLFRSVVDHCDRSRIIMYCLSAIGILLWEGGVFLILLNFIPPGLNIRKMKWRDWLFASLLLVIVVAYVKTDFRMMGDINPFPIDTAELASGTSLLHSGPVILVTTIFQHSIVWVLAALLPLCISIFYLVKIIRNPSPNFVITFFLAVVIIVTMIKASIAVVL
ncbi:MAG: hypothetical protein ACC707_14375 [Thiohalomonadales bacterium]